MEAMRATDNMGQSHVRPAGGTSPEKTLLPTDAVQILGEGLRPAANNHSPLAQKVAPALRRVSWNTGCWDPLAGVRLVAGGQKTAIRFQEAKSRVDVVEGPACSTLRKGNINFESQPFVACIVRTFFENGPLAQRCCSRI